MKIPVDLSVLEARTNGRHVHLGEGLVRSRTPAGKFMYFHRGKWVAWEGNCGSVAFLHPHISKPVYRGLLNRFILDERGEATCEWNFENNLHTRREIKKAPSPVPLCVFDSLMAGNCLLGTLTFCQKFMPTCFATTDVLWENVSYHRDTMAALQWALASAKSEE